ncbi:MAG: hypothetical protein HWE26_09700 [Alteromonadaceae bacterium]|nr:hypothetical protein [Alteromonadaceae bacterium]
MNIIKAVFFYPLLWLRGIFLGIGKISSVICLVSSVLMIILKMTEQFSTIEWVQIIPTAVIGFGTFILMEFYDQIILKLNPSGAELTLYK